MFEKEEITWKDVQPHYMGNKSNETYFGAWHSGKKFFFGISKYCYTISDGNIVWIANYYAVQLVICTMCFW